MRAALVMSIVLWVLILRAAWAVGLWYADGAQWEPVLRVFWLGVMVAAILGIVLLVIRKKGGKS